MTENPESKPTRGDWQAEDGLFHGTCAFCHASFTHILPRRYCPGGECQYKAGEERRRQARLPSYAPDKTCHCLMCGHEWQKRVKEPVYCPRCLSKRWNGDYGNRNEVSCRCAICRHEWQRRHRERPVRCPKCLSYEWDIDTVEGVLRAVKEAVRLCQVPDVRITQIRDIIHQGTIPSKSNYPKVDLPSPPEIPQPASVHQDPEMDHIMREMFPPTTTDPNEIIDISGDPRTLLPPSEATKDTETDEELEHPLFQPEEDEGLRMIREAFRENS